MIVNQKTASVRLPRDDVRKTFLLELAEHVVELDWEISIRPMAVRLEISPLTVCICLALVRMSMILVAMLHL
jgi:hypothetical protein